MTNTGKPAGPYKRQGAARVVGPSACGAERAALPISLAAAARHVGRNDALPTDIWSTAPTGMTTRFSK